jgi:hypothetical protein
MGISTVVFTTSVTASRVVLASANGDPGLLLKERATSAHYALPSAPSVAVILIPADYQAMFGLEIRG